MTRSINEDIFDNDIQDISLKMDVDRKYEYMFTVMTSIQRIEWDEPWIIRLYNLLFTEPIGWTDVLFEMELIFDSAKYRKQFNADTDETEFIEGFKSMHSSMNLNTLKIRILFNTDVRPKFFRFAQFIFNLYKAFGCIFDYRNQIHNSSFFSGKYFALNTVSGQYINDQSVMTFMKPDSHISGNEFCTFMDYMVDFYREIYSYCQIIESDVNYIAKIFKLHDSDRKLLMWHLMSSERPFDITYQRTGGNYNIYLDPEYDFINFSDIQRLLEECIVSDDGNPKKVQLMAKTRAARKLTFYMDVCDDIYKKYKINLEFPVYAGYVVEGLTLDELYVFINTCISTYTNINPFRYYENMEIDFVEVRDIPDNDWYYFNYMYDSFKLMSSSEQYEVKALKRGQFKLRKKK